MPTSERTARNICGCCVSSAPISRPPLLPPSMARCGDDVLCASSEVIEDILLVQQLSAGVPAFSVFCAATQIGLDKDAAMIKPKAAEAAHKARRNADRVAAICSQESRVRPIEPGPLPHQDRHWDPGSIF